VNWFIVASPRNISIGLVIDHQNEDLSMTSITKLPFANEAASIRGATPPRAARRAPAIKLPALNLGVSHAAIIREVLTFAAVGGLIWFQWEIVRCCW